MSDMRNQFGECDRWVRQHVKRGGEFCDREQVWGAAQYSYIPAPPPRYE